MQSPPSGGVGIPLEVAVGDPVVQNEPDRGQHLPGDGDLDLHPALSPDHRLVVAEPRVEAYLCLGRAPYALYQCLPQVLVAVRDPPRLDHAGALVVARPRPVPDCLKSLGES